MGKKVAGLQSQTISWQALGKLKILVFYYFGDKLNFYS